MNIIDLRSYLPKNTIYPKVRSWQKRNVSSITTLVVHHDASIAGNLYNARERAYGQAINHIHKDWGSGNHAYTLTYHYKIARDGTVYLCNDKEWITWHASDANPFSLGICLDGNFQVQQPSNEQLKSLEELLGTLRTLLGIDKEEVFGHGELKEWGNDTVCCGANLLPYVKKYRDKGYMLDEQLPDYEAEWVRQGFGSVNGKTVAFVDMESTGNNPLSQLGMYFRADPTVTPYTDSKLTSGHTIVELLDKNIYRAILEIKEDLLEKGEYREDFGLALGSEWKTTFNFFFEWKVL